MRQIRLALEGDTGAVQREVWKTGEDRRVSEATLVLQSSPSLPVLENGCVCVSHRFTMVFSEVPDMSDTSHDFVQQHQKEKEAQVR